MPEGFDKEDDASVERTPFWNCLANDLVHEIQSLGGQRTRPAGPERLRCECVGTFAFEDMSSSSSLYHLANFDEGSRASPGLLVA